MAKLKLPRFPDLPKKSFFLFGPRGVGKSSLLRHRLGDNALYIDLLRSSEYLPLATNPSLLREKVENRPSGSWVVIDEIQRIPELLNEVHALYEDLDLKFALSGSSSRKIKRGGGNLLAGRALQFFLLPFLCVEWGKLWSFEKAIDWGSIPGVVVDPEHKIETLETYVETYLKQELMEEGLIRKAEPFLRFLSVAGLRSAQVLNMENVARESSVRRTTVQTYFQILEDTLIGYLIPAYRPGLKAKEVSHPKFYFFDPGVARACAGQLRQDLENDQRGFAFESLIIQHIRAYNVYEKKGWNLSFYSVTGSTEIDLVIETRKKSLSSPQEIILLEIKLAKKWDPRWSEAMNSLLIENKKAKVKGRFGIYCGSSKLTSKGIDIWPVETFFDELFKGKLF